MTGLERVRVDLAERGYDILVGEDLLDAAGRHVGTLAPRGPLAVVTDRTVADLHLPRFRRSLRAEGFEVEELVLPPGEATKDFAHLEQVLERLLQARVERGGLVIALGGGVIGDLTGLAAALLRRGTGFVQVPTTLLAQVDSSVGGKTAVNSRYGKNLVGSFYQPRLVLADIGVLASLPRRQLLAGYAEVAKYGLLGDAALFDWLERHGAALLAGDAALRRRAVVASCRAKAAIVGRDEREEGERALLNLGHTFGHALEAATGFSDALLHGEGVAIGMVMAFDLSVRLGLCPAADAARVRAHLAAMGLPTGMPGALAGRAADELFHHMRQDKKVQGGRMTFVLARGIGQAFLSDAVPEAEVLALLQQALAA